MITDFRWKKHALLGATLCLAFAPAAGYAALFTSTQAGLWTDSATWGGLGTPGAGDDVVILHNVTAGGPISFQTLAINAGTFNMGTNQTATIGNGGSVTLSGGTFVPDTSTFLVQSGGATLTYVSGQSRATLSDASPVSMLAFNALTVNGTATLSTNIAVRTNLTLSQTGFISGNAPTYLTTTEPGPPPTTINPSLIYTNTSGSAITRTRGLEWSATTAATYPAPGLPYRVEIGSSAAVTLQLGNASFQRPRTIGDVVVNALSTLSLNGPAPLTEPLTVGGRLVINAGSTVALSTSAGGNLNLRGDLILNGNTATLTHNNRSVRFEGTLPQAIATETTRSNGITFYDLVIANTSVDGVRVNLPTASPSTAPVVTVSGGGNLTVQSGSVFNSQRRVSVSGGSVVNQGTFNLSPPSGTNQLSLTNGNLVNSGVLNLASANVVLSGNTAAVGQLQNTGTVSASNSIFTFTGAHGRITSDVALNNVIISNTNTFALDSGVTFILTGDLTYNPATGVFNAGSGSTLFFNSGNAQLFNVTRPITIRNLNVGSSTTLIQANDSNNITRAENLTLNGTISMTRSLEGPGDDPDGPGGPETPNGTLYTFGLTQARLDFGEANNGNVGNKGAMTAFTIERTADSKVPVVSEFFSLIPDTDPGPDARAHITLPQRTSLTSPGIFQYLVPFEGPVYPPGSSEEPNNIVNGAWTTRDSFFVTLDNQQDLTTARVVQDPGGVLSVDLVSFTATADEAGNATVKWVTAGEFDNAGFNLYRATGSNLGGVGEKLNAILIPSEGNAATGSTYTFVDPTPLAPGEVRGYYLEDVEIGGKKSMAGPAVASRKSDQPRNAAEVLSGLTLVNWESVAPSTVFAAPEFIGGDGNFLGIRLPQELPANGVFGMWQTREALAPLPAGTYRIQANVEFDTPEGKFAPGLRLRSFEEGHLINTLTETVDWANRTKSMPGSVSTYFESDGQTPWYVAIDLVSFDDEHGGGFRVTGVTVTPVQ